MGKVIGGIVGAVGGLVGANKQAKAAKSATRAQSRAAANELALYRDIFETTTENQQPFIDAGHLGNQALLFELGLGAAPNVNGQPFGGFQESQDFKFGLQTGVDAIDASASARGNLFSGSTLTALNKFGQDYGSLRRSEYLSRLGALSGQGQQATQALANSANAFSQGAGSALSSIGNAQAAGAIAQGNAFAGGLNAVTQGIGQIVGGIGGTPVPTVSPFGPGGFY